LTLYDKIFEDAYLFMKQNLKPKMELLECNYIVQVCTHKHVEDKQELGSMFLNLCHETMNDMNMIYPTVCESAGGPYPNQGDRGLGR